VRILWLSHLVPYPATGIGVLQRSHNLLKALCGRYEVDLVTFIQPGLLENAFGSVDAGLRRAEEALSRLCHRVAFVDLPIDVGGRGREMLALKCLINGSSYSVAWLSSGDYRAQVSAWSEEAGYDLVHYDTISLGEYRDAARARRHVLNHHNIESHMMARRAHQEGNPLKRAYFGIEAKRLRDYEIAHCGRFDLHLTCSSLDSDRLAELVPGLRTEVVPNGVDVEYFTPGGAPAGEGRLVFAGGLDWYPNADAMLYFAREVWPLLSAARPEVAMEVIGRSPPRALQDLAERDARFRVHGFVDDVRPYIDAADVYVCPIRDGGGTKLKVLDALAMGKPLVAHPLACEGIPVVDGRQVLFAESPQDFSDRITWLLDRPEERQRMQEEARRFAVEHFSYERIGDRLCRLYEDLVREHG